MKAHYGAKCAWICSAGATCGEMPRLSSPPTRKKTTTVCYSELAAGAAVEPLPNQSGSLRHGQGRNRTADTRIFSSVAVPRLCVTIGPQPNELKRLKALCYRANFASKQIGATTPDKTFARSINASAAFFNPCARRAVSPIESEKAHKL